MAFSNACRLQGREVSENACVGGNIIENGTDNRGMRHDAAGWK